MKLSEIRNLFTALSMLDGEQKVVKNKGQEEVILEPYKFAGKTSWNLVKNKNILKRYNDDYTEVNDQLIRRISGAESINKEDPVQVKEYTDETKKLLETEEDVKGILRIKLSELNLDTNHIPISILELLSTIVDDDNAVSTENKV